MNRKFGENPDHQNEQLDLSLRLHLGNPCSKSSPKPTRLAMKMYKCKFCTRKFCNSQALGGHQNSHRKEREAVKIKMYCQFTINHHSDHLHDAASTPRGDGDRTGFARLTENGSGYGLGSVQAEPGVNLNSCGGSYYYSNPQVVEVNRIDPDSLDLNLKL